MQNIVRALRLNHKLAMAVAVASLAFVLVPNSVGFSAKSALVWNAGGLTYLALAFRLMSISPIKGIMRRARIEDETRVVFFVLILLAVLSSFYAVFALIGDAKKLTGSVKTWHIALAASTVLVSWLVMQVIFTLHYAHAFYASKNSTGAVARGMKFPDDDAPDYWDFFYFTTSIGATSQTSDVAITSKGIRRMVAFQAVLSFVFNTTIVALAINLASGLI